MANKPVHTVPNKDGGWDNKREGSQRPKGHYDTKAEAVKNGRKLAMNSKTEHTIHNKDGKIGYKKTMEMILILRKGRSYFGV